jgi:tetratricopeptide (TPR) repeat protein
LLQGRYQEAITAFNHAGELSPVSALPASGIGQVYLSQGDYDRAITTFLSARVVGEPAMNDFWLSLAYAGRGDKQKALDFLQKAFEANFRDFAAVESSPYFSSLRPDPRFMALVSRYRKQQN